MYIYNFILTAVIMFFDLIVWYLGIPIVPILFGDSLVGSDFVNGINTKK